MFDKLKIGATLYHVIGYDNVIKTKITKIESNSKGIYLYAEDEKNTLYRFILIVYSTGKTHFGDSVFVRLNDYVFSD